MDTHAHDRRRFPVSLIAPHADTTGPRPEDPVRPAVPPENLLLFEADGPPGPGRLIGTR